MAKFRMVTADRATGRVTSWSSDYSYRKAHNFALVWMEKVQSAQDGLDVFVVMDQAADLPTLVLAHWVRNRAADGGWTLMAQPDTLEDVTQRSQLPAPVKAALEAKEAQPAPAPFGTKARLDAMHSPAPVATKKRPRRLDRPVTLFRVAFQVDANSPRVQLHAPGTWLVTLRWTLERKTSSPGLDRKALVERVREDCGGSFPTGGAFRDIHRGGRQFTITLAANDVPPDAPLAAMMAESIKRKKEDRAYLDAHFQDT